MMEVEVDRLEELRRLQERMGLEELLKFDDLNE